MENFKFDFLYHTDKIRKEVEEKAFKHLDEYRKENPNEDLISLVRYEANYFSLISIEVSMNLLAEYNVQLLHYLKSKE